MYTRSRKGCIDCKQAKIKCDEVHPSCGTCLRRRRQCKGYRVPRTVHAELQSPFSGLHGSVITNDSSEVGSEVQSEISWTSSTAEWQGVDRSSPKTQSRPGSPKAIEIALSSPTGRAADYLETAIWETSAQWLLPTRNLSLIPPNVIMAADKPFIEIYFMRHPSEMVISNDFFINEMNGAVISLLQQSPTAVGDSLCAIGENYVMEPTGVALVSHRKTRLLNRLRLVNEDENSPELVLLLLLALCGAELTDPRSDGKGNMLPAIIENVALVLEFHTRSGRELSDAAKYFARGVARQDLLISLSRMQRVRIDPRTWLDEYSMSHADRLLGLTTSLIPILAKLAALAEDVRSSIDYDYYSIADDMCILIDSSDHLTYRTDLVEREASIRAQLVGWHPIRDCSMSMQASRKLLLHAAAWKAAALLYLFRLFNHPGSSRAADETALSMSYEVLMHISGPADDIKLSLWPLFIAACELNQPEDRDLATQLFNDICHARPNRTAKRTKTFCVDQIWPARDEGKVWDWMYLTRRDSNVFMPL